MQMRNRLMLIALPLCAVMLAAGVAVAAPNGGEHFNDTKLDDPHVVRPIAASSSTEGELSLDVIYLEQVDAASALVALQTAPPPPVPEPEPEPEPAPAPTPIRTPAPAVASSGNGDFLSCVRSRESGGDYTVHNSGGSGASGAYQFMPGTWNSIAGSSGRGDLVGVDPAAASPADQDAMAHALYAQQGSSPWGGSCS
jgi:hypothetical protein